MISSTQPHLKLLDIPLNQLRVNPDQPRKEFDIEKIEELAQSIQKVGLIQPILVKKVEDDFYQIIAGERRFRACQHLERKTVQACLIEVSRGHINAAALIENIHRQDLSALEIARYLQYLIDVENWSQTELASSIGKPRSTVCNYLRLLSLPEKVQVALEKNQITMGHAKALMALSTSVAQSHYLEKVLETKMSVRRLESLIRSAKNNKKQNDKSEPMDYHLKVVEDQISHHLSTKVEIKGSEDGGVLCLHYYSQNDLERILELCHITLFEKN